MRWSSPKLIAALSTAGVLVAACAHLRSTSPFNRLVPDQLATPDSEFLDLCGLRLHLRKAGQGKPVMLLLHGFAASTFTWHDVFDRLAEIGTVIAIDRPGFGLTTRAENDSWYGANPFDHEAQADLVVALLDHFGIDRAVLIGHSAGGTVATLAALRYPTRFSALALIAPAIYVRLPPPPWLKPWLKHRPMQWLVPAVTHALARLDGPILRRAWHDPSRITPEIRAAYRDPFHLRGWDDAMLALVRADRPLDLPSHLNELTQPTLVIAGDDDRIVPTKQSLRLAAELPHAELVVIPDCGHIPQEERPEAFLQAIKRFVSQPAVMSSTPADE
ncbi:MAG TPA: alpha/beta hydrolase [Nitrolancea sp.]